MSTKLKNKMETDSINSTYFVEKGELDSTADDQSTGSIESDSTIGDGPIKVSKAGDREVYPSGSIELDATADNQSVETLDSIEGQFDAMEDSELDSIADDESIGSMELDDTNSEPFEAIDSAMQRADYKMPFKCDENTCGTTDYNEYSEIEGTVDDESAE